MPKLIVLSALNVLLCVVLGVLPAMAHEGPAGEHLMMGIGIGEVIGLVVGLALGAVSVLAFIKYRKPKS